MKPYIYIIFLLLFVGCDNSHINLSPYNSFASGNWIIELKGDFEGKATIHVMQDGTFYNGVYVSFLGIDNFAILYFDAEIRNSKILEGKVKAFNGAEIGTITGTVNNGKGNCIYKIRIIDEELVYDFSGTVEMIKK